MQLNGKVAIVTGGTKGIGKAIAEALVNAGFNVSICGRREDELQRAVSDLNQLDGDPDWRGGALGAPHVEAYADQVSARAGEIGRASCRERV